jgi:adenylate cyclase
VNARYQLRGKVRDDGMRRLRVMAFLTETATGRNLWADRWDGEAADVFAFEEHVATHVATAVERALRTAEIDRVRRQDPGQLDAWGLTMKAFPQAMQIDCASQTGALELLGRAMELAPNDGLPLALAAWCHAQRGGHSLTRRPDSEKQRARDLALRAARLGASDPLAESLLGAARTLAGDFAAAAVHVDRALALDGGCAWAWNRRGLLAVYTDQPADAIECFHIARSLGPDDTLSFYCSIGVASAHFAVGRYEEAARWFARGLTEHPQAVWTNRFRAPALLLAGRKEEARHSFADLIRTFPDLTIAEVRSALPFTASFCDRASEALSSLGMPG